MHRVRTRVSVGRALAVVMAALALITAFIPDWIEAVTGLDPDGGNGWLERLIVVGFAAISAAAWVIAHVDARRQRGRAGRRARAHRRRSPSEVT